MRLQSLDIARFIAFCGMVLVNFRIAANVTPQADVVSALTTALEGRAAALFVVLAGVGLALARPTTATLIKRALFLLAIGLVNMTVFDADILHFYGVYFLCALPFLGVSNRRLWYAICAVPSVSVLALVALNYDTGWNWDTYAYNDFWTVQGFLRHTFFNGWHPVFPWITFLLFGLWLGRKDLSSAALHRALMLWGALVAILGLIPAALTEDADLRELLAATAIPPGPFYILSAAGSACALLGLIGLITPVLERVGLAPWLTDAGRQSLTLYVAHILIGMGVLEEAGLLNGSLSTSQIFWISLGFCLLCMLYARAWKRVAKRGPLEAVMRKLTG
jgi:uncharacterized membrane protein YeiB